MSTFKDYIEAQANEILCAVDDEVREDPERFRQQAIAWIENNAEFFRRRWDQQHAA